MDVCESGADSVTFHGVDPANGGLLRAPKTWDQLRECVIATFRLRQRLADVRKARTRAAAPTKHRGRPPQGVDAGSLASAGWGVIYADGVEDAVKEALGPLLRHRKEQARALFKVFDGHQGLPPGIRASDWLRHLRIPTGVGDVSRVPYFLMVVGDPGKLPFGFEFDLAGSSYAVGRLAFDEPQAYARYAANVIAAETAPPRRASRLTLVGMQHPDDPATQGSFQHLVTPLLEHFEGDGVRSILGEAATKRAVAEVLGGPETPSLLCTAGHGMGPGPQGDLDRIGALLCAPYPGAGGWTGGALPGDWIFGARDLESEADLRGLVAVFFGCFTAGMPSHDSFCLEPPRPLGPARMSALAARILSHERGGLAVLGHVDRAWSFSYLWRGISQPHCFRSVLGSLLDGEPIGAAAAYLNDRYAAVSGELLQQMEAVLRNTEGHLDRFVADWMTQRDARGFLIYGDPAVHLPATTASSSGSRSGT